jgi:hypothetical protein
MSMQTMRLETKDGFLVFETRLPANGEPDAIVYGGRVFIRRAMRITEPPQKNDPEVYFEATAHHMPAAEAVPRVNKVTRAPTRIDDIEASVSIAIEDPRPRKRSGIFGRG